MTAVGLVLVTVAACTVDEGSPTGANVRLHETTHSSTAIGQDGQRLAEALARGLARPYARKALRDLLRRSRYTEHRIALTDFLQAEEGMAVLQAAAEESDEPVDSLRAVASRLGELDLYMPVREHRRTWQATPKIIVAFRPPNSGAKPTAFDPTGHAVLLTPETIGRPQSPALLALTRTEAKGVRINPQPSGPGDVIQDENDGEIGGQIIDYLPDGSTRVTELFDLMADRAAAAQSSEPTFGVLDELCSDATAFQQCTNFGTGSPPPPPPDTTYLDAVITVDLCDNDISFCGDNELEWHAHYFVDGVRIERRDIRIEGIPPTAQVPLHVPLIYRQYRSAGQQIIVDIVETDPFNTLDKLTPSPVLDGSDDNGRAFGSGDVNCSNPLFPCTAAYFWHEVNSSFTWNATQ